MTDSAGTRTHASYADTPTRSQSRALQARAWLRRNRTDCLIALGIFAIAAIGVFMQSGLLDPRLAGPGADDVWFDADVYRTVTSLTDRWAEHFRDKVHPLFSVLLLPLGVLLHRVGGLSPFEAVHVVSAVVAGLWFASFYALCRLLRLRVIDSVLSCVMAATTAAAVFWFAIPETHSLGSLSILLALVFVAASRERAVGPAYAVLVSAFTLGITVTNAFVGWLAALVHRRLRSALAIAAGGLALVLVLSSIGRLAIPNLAFMLARTSREAGYILTPEASGVRGVMTSLYMHTAVMPAIEVVDMPGAGEWPVMISQPAMPGSAGPAGITAVSLWTLLLVLGTATLLIRPPFAQFRWFLLLALAGETTVFLVFGQETFLYSPNVLPLLMALAVLPLQTRARPLALGLICAIALFAGFNNVSQFRRANRMFSDFATMRHVRAFEIRRRPDDPWPRTEPRLRIGRPGQRAFAQGIHELGGSLSPGLDQFGLSFWVLEQDGTIHTTSSTIDADSIEQTISEADDSGITAIETRTPYYTSHWSQLGPRRFRLDLSIRSSPCRFAVVVRSAEPERGPIRSLAWNGTRLLVNDRYTIRVEGLPVDVHLGIEGSPGWTLARDDMNEIRTPTGWGWARFAFPTDGDIVLHVEDMHPDGPIYRPLAVLR